MFEQRIQPSRIVQINQISFDHIAHQKPEAILPVRIVLPLSQRHFAGQASENQYPRIDIDDRWKTALKRHACLSRVHQETARATQPDTPRARAACIRSPSTARRDARTPSDAQPAYAAQRSLK